MKLDFEVIVVFADDPQIAFVAESYITLCYAQAWVRNDGVSPA